ncbi:S-methyl-5-thioribose-1-phosphate isomerase [Lachnoclostridium sp. Marseille-P6806]|uniref:S-methyl-5-thioribose-1-phosphate isomerase n=1 Tax=Lachnoclostridium sp. Marseille-P6806 TaxID=2364793 RepID=UPI0010320904|nr:S-methyl-5-thioribose-1-phosphate isomerase [Lachnoclostridium sp. Marseille-P6806]
MDKSKTILDCDTVSLLKEEDALLIIDQTKLPGELRLIRLRTAEEIWEAIYLLQVRGAPAIGVTAALGIYLLAKKAQLPEKDTVENYAVNFEALSREFRKQKVYLESSRPTAVNLSWALCRMECVLMSLKEEQGMTVEKALSVLGCEAEEIREEDIRVCRSIGEYGLSLVGPGDGLLTHCNAGRLATIRYGTATAPMYLGHERGYGFHIYCDETRPLLQGARLTAYELAAAGMDVTLECDNMSASLMKSGKVQAVFVGCDRVAANGDAANKIGTSLLALAAKRYGVPFYVCAPTSTIDMSLSSGDQIPIEQRKPEEVTEMWYAERMAPEGIQVYNPAFDVTESDLISGIVTEYGVARAPYTESLRDIFEKKASEKE